MTTAVDDLVSLFAAKLRMDGTRVSPVAQGSRNVLVEYHGDHLTLVLPEGDLSMLLAEGDELARDLWGPSVSAQEAAARLMTVHLQESLESSGLEDLSGTWTYRSGFFFRSRPAGQRVGSHSARQFRTFPQATHLTSCGL